MRLFPRRTQTGVSIVEVILGVGIITTLVVTIGYTMNAYVDTRSVLLTDTKALYLAEEGMELLRAARDDDWDTITALPLDTRRYFDLSGGTIAITTTPEVIDTDFERHFVISSLYRNSDDDVVDSTAPGASVDASGRVADVFVVTPTGTSTFAAILTNIHADN